jgi:hypothetical protein
MNFHKSLHIKGVGVRSAAMTAALVSVMVVQCQAQQRKDNDRDGTRKGEAPAPRCYSHQSKLYMPFGCILALTI